MIIILLFIVIGMIIGLLIRPNDSFKGPNALQESKKIYYHKPSKKCYRFAIQLLKCPLERKKYHQFIDIYHHFKNNFI